MNQPYTGTAEQTLSDLQRLRVPAPLVEKRHDFIEYLGGRHQARLLPYELLPVVPSLLMMLVVSGLQGNDVACVEEYAAHSVDS